MNQEELKIKIMELFPSSVILEGGEWVNIQVEPDMLLSVSKEIRNNESLHFDYLFCLTCIDWQTHLTMVYHFESTVHRHSLVLKINLDRDNPEIESLSQLWKTAEFHEREVFELFGVQFLNHPDLRKLLLSDEWSGFPLRKDFEDPINMIKL